MVRKDFSPGPEPAVGGSVCYHVRYHVLQRFHSSATEDRSLLSCDVPSLGEFLSVTKDRDAIMFQGHYSPSNQSRIPQGVNLYVLFYFLCDKRSSNWSGKIVNLSRI